MNTVYALVAIGALGFFVYLGQQNLTGAQQAEKKLYASLNIEEKSPQRKDKVVLTDAEWKKRLTSDQYKILRAKGTEAAFCSPFLDNHKHGVYYCAGCGLPLFKADDKFDSGTGWPSFFQPFDRKNIWFRSDTSYGMYRVEVLCARCDGHLGHVFTDGPADKTGLRFCINGEALVFKPNKD
ncbi:MAG TPA: peptide-methionine (R)-S-oxide reductase MsrB [Fimbriimonadaceae bacterium]|nr:peptide-methionine (R)-S-oxide reductase MsrB [Fimbriimonadaceae bacterium]